MTASAASPLARPSPFGWPAWLLAFVSVTTLIGLALRIAAARGDLWLDEILSVGLVQDSSLRRIMLGLPVDNNHLLNSAWLWAIGSNPAPLLARLPAIVFGTICVPIAARLGNRRNTFAGAFAAALVATDGMLVHFSSEARGYAGLILATFVALDAIENYMDDPADKRPLVIYGLAIGFGTFSHYTMVASSAALVAAAAIRVWYDHGATRRAWSMFRPILDATVRGAIPAFTCLAASIYFGHHQIGLQTPYSFDTLISGLGSMAAATLGAPAGVNDLILVLAIPLAAAALVVTPARRRGFPLAAIVAVTAARVILHVPNEQFARFHLTVAIGLIVLVVELAAFARDALPSARIAVTLLLSVVLLGEIGYDIALAHVGRGGYSAAVSMMASDGHVKVSIRSPGLFKETSAVLGFHDRVGVLDATEGCAADPRWVLVVDIDTSIPVHDVAVPAIECDGRRYVLKGSWGTTSLAGDRWLVYERDRLATASAM